MERDCELGATQDECASAPGLLIELSMAYHRKRLALARGIVLLIDRPADDPDRQRAEDAWADCTFAVGEMSTVNHRTGPEECMKRAEDLRRALARLEDLVAEMVQDFTRRSVMRARRQTSPVAPGRRLAGRAAV